ncbi:MAG: hypothetical protein KGL39_38270 [Patescibacteria group bacterium]|nr:hypothetical protein [Patescibacteria group bacterium]
MTRHVYPTSEVPHLWANQTQQDARNPQGNLFFEGATIYSYRHSWPLATIYRKGKGKHARTLVLTNSERYGTTTARHQYIVNSACSQFDQIAVPYPAVRADLTDSHHVNNVMYLQDVAADLLKKAMQGRSDWHVQYGRERSQGLITQATQYMQWFGLKGKRPVWPADDWRVAEQRMHRILNPDPASLNTRERERAQRQQRARAQLEAQFNVYADEVRAYNAACVAAAGANTLELWRAHQPIPDRDIPMPYLSYTLLKKWRAAGFDVPQRSGRGSGYLPMALRLSADGQQIETTRGARIPVDHAPRLWRLIEACRASQREYVRNGHTEHAGVYAIDKVAADGTLTAGCHVIPYAELRLMALALGYIKE